MPEILLVWGSNVGFSVEVEPLFSLVMKIIAILRIISLQSCGDDHNVYPVKIHSNR